MALNTFVPPIPPSPGTTVTYKVRLLKSGFGDGYVQATPDGLNSTSREISLSWDTLLPAQAQAIVAFMVAQMGCIPFYYTPSDDPTPVKWTCEDWDDKRGQGGLRTVTCKLVESFALQS